MHGTLSILTFTFAVTVPNPVPVIVKVVDPPFATNVFEAAVTVGVTVFEYDTVLATAGNGYPLTLIYAPQVVAVVDGLVVP